MEGNSDAGAARRGGAGMDEGRKSFWDDFSSLADQQQQPKKSGAIGTSAMGSSGSKGPKGPAAKDEWDDW